MSISHTVVKLITITMSDKVSKLFCASAQTWDKWKKKTKWNDGNSNEKHVLHQYLMVCWPAINRIACNFCHPNVILQNFNLFVKYSNAKYKFYVDIWSGMPWYRFYRLHAVEIEQFNLRLGVRMDPFDFNRCNAISGQLGVIFYKWMMNDWG